MAGIIVAQTLRRNRKITPTTSPIVSSKVVCTSATDARMVVVRSEITESLIVGGIDASNCGNAAWIACTVLITFAPGRRWIARMMPGCKLTQPFRVSSCGPLIALADIGHPDRPAVAIGDDLMVPGGRGKDLIVGLQCGGAAFAVQAALRLIDADIGQRRAHVLQVETVGGKLRRIELHANGRVLFAADADQADTGYLRQLLCQDALGIVVHGGDRQRVGGESEHQDGGVRRIGLMICRRCRHVFRQLAGRRVDCRLHELCGGVDVVVQSELQCDLGVAN